MREEDRTAVRNRYTGKEKAAIEVKGLSKTYTDGNKEIYAIQDVSFAAEPGNVIGILGPNGAGKTTIIKSMLGLIIPSKGKVEIEGINVHENHSEAYERVSAMLEGARNIYWRLTIRENLEYFSGSVGKSPTSIRERHNALLKMFGLLDKSDEPVKIYREE
jgi:ABC-2 type transport system ATP-binding protein